MKLKQKSKLIMKVKAKGTRAVRNKKHIQNTEHQRWTFLQN